MDKNDRKAIRKKSTRSRMKPGVRGWAEPLRRWRGSRQGLGRQTCLQKPQIYWEAKKTGSVLFLPVRCSEHVNVKPTGCPRLLGSGSCSLFLVLFCSGATKWSENDCLNTAAEYNISDLKDRFFIQHTGC